MLNDSEDDALLNDLGYKPSSPGFRLRGILYLGTGESELGVETLPASLSASSADDVACRGDGLV